MCAPVGLGYRDRRPIPALNLVPGEDRNPAPVRRTCRQPTKECDNLPEIGCITTEAKAEKRVVSVP